MELKWIVAICAVVLGVSMGYGPLVIRALVKQARERSRKTDLTFKIAELRIKQRDERLSGFEKLQLEKLLNLRNKT